MTNALIKKYAKETDKSVEEIEKLWDESKEACTLDKKDKYYYLSVVKILKNKFKI